MTIADDATTLLIRLAELQRALPDTRNEYVDGPTIDRLLQIGPERLNDAVALSEENGFLEVLKTFGTGRFDFNSVRLLSRGRFEAERITSAAETKSDTAEETTFQSGIGGGTRQQIKTVAQPVGSPYGFKTEDWEAVAADHADAGRLIVGFGHQWKSDFFDSNLLRDAVKRMFESALNDVTPELRRNVRLDFRVLRGGYGSHLFNRIARDIICSDIAVFDTSDWNPNVMLELGVALTWGVQVLPIRHVSARELPSDVSGQTWTLSDDNGERWIDPEHVSQLRDLVKIACKRKPRRT